MSFNFKIHKDKLKILFFDLEFYVPESNRDQLGFLYNPWDKACRLLGGSFLTANMSTQLSLKNLDENVTRITSEWLWNYNSERELVEKLYSIIKEASDSVRGAHEGKRSLILCGIGITHSDVPALFDLFKRYKILSNSDAFKFQNQIRSIDISQLAIAAFAPDNGPVELVRKNTVLMKYFQDLRFESGVSVWSMYDNEQYTEIEKRTNSEVSTTLECFLLMLKDFRRSKTLLKEDKKYRKKKEKERLNLLEASDSENSQ